MGCEVSYAQKNITKEEQEGIFTEQILSIRFSHLCLDRSTGTKKNK